MILTLTFIMTLLLIIAFFYILVGRVFFTWLKWIIKGRPYITYPGYHCGLCGKWTYISFTIPKYKSDGEWLDTWGICKKCIRVKKDDMETAESLEKPLQDETDFA